RKSGDQKLGTRCELKNLNSFRFMEQAIEFEAKRQIDILEDGGRIEQETRLYDPDRNETRSMRSKEDAQDYRYFPDPDLLPLVIKQEQIDRLRGEQPELPQAKKERYQREFALSAYDANLLVESRDKADLFEKANAAVKNPKVVANWVNGEVTAVLKVLDL